MRSPRCCFRYGARCARRDCVRSPHTELLPPLRPQGQHYERWSHYVDGDKTGINSERRGEGRRLRRQRRKERLRQQEHEVCVFSSHSAA